MGGAWTRRASTFGVRHPLHLSFATWVAYRMLTQYRSIRRAKVFRIAGTRAGEWRALLRSRKASVASRSKCTPESPVLVGTPRSASAEADFHRCCEAGAKFQTVGSSTNTLRVYLGRRMALDMNGRAATKSGTVEVWTVAGLATLWTQTASPCVCFLKEAPGE